MKGNAASSFPSGFLDLEGSPKKTNEAFNTFNNSPSFTGFRPDMITQAAQTVVNGATNVWHKVFSKNVVQIKNYGDFLSKTDEFIGEGFINARVEKFRSLLGEEKAAKILSIHDDTLEFVENSMANKLLNGLLDIPRILLDAPNALIRGAKKLPVVGKLGFLDTIANIPPLKNRANEKAAMDIFYRLKGMAEYEKAPELIRREIFKVPAGAAVANYVTKDERSLNRLATGAVSTYFVGNDFYNLAMYEKNDSKEAKKTANKRMRREMVRIGSSAIMTYSVLSALSTYVNKSRVLACVAIAGSAFFTEVISRVLMGTPLLPLTPKGAKKLNRKRAEKKEKLAFKASKGKKENAETTQTIQNSAQNASQNSSQNALQNSKQNVSQNATAQNVLQNSVQNLAPAQAAQTASPSLIQPIWYNNSQNNPALKNAFSQFANPASNPASKTIFKGDSSKAGMEKQNQGTNPASANSNNKNQNVDRNKPFGLKHVAGAALAALGISLAYCAARTRSEKFNSFIENTANYLHNLRKLVSTKDLIVKNDELQKFFEGFDGLQSEHIRRGYSALIDVEFTEEQVEKLLSKSINNYVSFDKNNPIFAKAYLRSSAMLDPVSTKAAGTEFIAESSQVVGTDMPLRLEHSAAAGRGKFGSIDDDFVPDYVRSRKTFAEIKEELRKKPEPPKKKEPEKIVGPYVINDVAPYSAPVEMSSRKPGGPFESNLKFKNIRCTFDLESPSTVRDGVRYYKMKDATFNFGKIEETKLKIVIDAIEIPIKYAKMVFTLPLKAFRKLAGIEMPKVEKNKDKAKIERVIPDVGEFFRDCSAMFKKYKKGKISQEEFSKYIENVNMKPFSIETTTRYSPTSLASLSRNFVTLISSYFFINDFRNEVLLQSDGENTEKAHEVTKERMAHKASNFVLNKFFMEVFNNAFNKQYLSSLLGATAVATATELTNESSVRVSIGVPLDRMNSREEIDEYEKKHLEQKGFKGVYYRFMARLTGKKMLSEKAEK